MASIRLKYIHMFVYLTIPGLSNGMWDTIPPPGTKPRPPALGAQGLSHWSTREVPTDVSLVLTASE